MEYIKQIMQANSSGLHGIIYEFIKSYLTCGWTIAYCDYAMNQLSTEAGYSQFL